MHCKTFQFISKLHNCLTAIYIVEQFTNFQKLGKGTLIKIMYVIHIYKQYKNICMLKKNAKTNQDIVNLTF